MINVKATIFNTLTKAFDRMRLLGDNNTGLLKKILFLVVLDDIYDWSNYLDDNQSVQKRLQELRANFILCNPEFEVCRTPFDLHYVNVNTPQTDYTWKRVWDFPGVKVVDSAEESVKPHRQEWVPDYTCDISIVYFGSEEEIKADPITGEPLVDLRNLTTCEKMNIYLNRETGELWYLNTNGVWVPISGGEEQSISPETIKNIVRSGLTVSHNQGYEGVITSEISDSQIPIEFCTDQEVEDLI